MEDEVAHLEVYVYEDEADNLYVHHDIMLPAIPLCVEWLGVSVGKDKFDREARGNSVAVGTFDPDIELWDLDIVDGMYPNAILGQGANASGVEPDTKKKKRKKSKKANDAYHVDAVLSLAANREHKNLLASSSADMTVKLWDLGTTTCAQSYSQHTDKVCSIAWNPRMSTVLLSGSYDRTVVAADMRAPAAQAPRWGVESDVESVRWDPHNSQLFYVSKHPLVSYVTRLKMCNPGLHGEGHTASPRRAASTSVARTVQAALDATSPRRSGVIVRHQSRNPWLSRDGLHGQGGETVERASGRAEHGCLAQPRPRQGLLDGVCARCGSWLQAGRGRQQRRGEGLGHIHECRSAPSVRR